jgi:hypothetical protein
LPSPGYSTHKSLSSIALIFCHLVTIHFTSHTFFHTSSGLGSSSLWTSSGFFLGSTGLGHVFLGLSSSGEEPFHLSFHLSPHLSSHLSCHSSIIGAAGFCSGFPSLFLLNVLENHGNPITNHLVPPSTASVHGCHATVFVISIAASVNLDVAS